MRQRITYANVAATLALVFSMTGGAIAANHYLINSARQISPKVLRKLHGAKGKAGATGPQGKQGSQGAAGAAGAAGGEGRQGPVGPSNAYTAFNTGFTSLKFKEEPTLVSVAVPAGSYVVTAKVQAINETAERQLVTCIASNDVNEATDQSSATVEPIGLAHFNGREVIAVEVASLLAAPGHWQVKCSSSNSTEVVKADEAQISAVQVGTLSRVEQ